MNQPLIQLKNIDYAYHAGDKAIPILNQVNLEVYAGQRVALVGASGSGKSTLLSLLGLLDNPQAGRYYLAGRDTRQLSDQAAAVVRNQMMGFVYQSFFLLGHLNAWQNVELPLCYRGLPEAVRRVKVDAALAHVGLLTHAQQKPAQLSGGEQQRVAIARALVGEPALILADEPTGALDSKNRDHIMDIFMGLTGPGRATLLMVTHDEIQTRYCERILRVADGLLVEDVS